MQATISNTKLFKDIFPDYLSFREWYISIPLSDGEEDVPSNKTFTLIAYEYNDCHVSMSAESFKEHFAIELYTYYREFEATTKSIIDLMQLTDEEISTQDSVVTNLANIPETESSTNQEEVNFISTQQKTINKKGNLQIKKEQLANKKVFTVRTFINRFRHLFIRVISPSYNYIVSEDEEE